MRRSYTIHAAADFEDFAGHAGGVAEEADLAARDVGPIHRKFDDAEAEFAEQQAKLDVKGEADGLLMGAYFFEGGSAEDFQSALGIVGGHVADDRDESGEDAAGEVALERALDGAAKHFHPTGEKGIGGCRLGGAKKFLRPQDFR